MSARDYQAHLDLLRAMRMVVEQSEEDHWVLLPGPIRGPKQPARTVPIFTGPISTDEIEGVIVRQLGV